jgi:structural maintenance of chromosome 4
MKHKGSKDDVGLLEYLEDIIGTNQYFEPIEELAVKIEAISEHHSSVLERVRIAGEDKNSLEEEMHEAKVFLEEELNLLRFNAIQIQLNLKQKNEEKANCKESIRQNKNKLLHEREKLERNSTETKEVKEKLYHLNEEHEELGCELETIHSEFAIYERKDAVFDPL